MEHDDYDHAPELPTVPQLRRSLDRFADQVSETLWKLCDPKARETLDTLSDRIGETLHALMEITYTVGGCIERIERLEAELEARQAGEGE